MKKRRAEAALQEEPQLDQPPPSATAAVKVPRPLLPFGNSTDAERLQESIDSDWKREIDDDAEEVEAFQRIPSFQRVRRSLKSWREQMSSPAVDLSVGAVCAQRRPAADVHTFAVSQSSESKCVIIGEKLLLFMQNRLQHNIVMPGHLSAELPEGMFLYCCYICSLRVFLFVRSAVSACGSGSRRRRAGHEGGHHQHVSGLLFCTQSASDS